jgi:hypothetical protein
VVSVLGFGDAAAEKPTCAAIGCPGVVERNRRNTCIQDTLSGVAITAR